MKYSLNKGTLSRLLIACVALGALVGLAIARTPATSVNIVNNSNKDIRNVYISHVDVDDWSGDQLSDNAVISPGQSASLGNLACDQQQVKVIAEDADGCFLSTVINCGDSATWTITNSTARDCGSN